jgi:hypothetical protein
MPSTTSTVEDHSHTDSPTLAGLESRAQTFRGPNSILRGATTHTKWASAGQPAKSSPPLPRCQLARTGGGIGAAPLGHPVPGTTTPQAARGPAWATHHPRASIRSPPMLSTGKGQGSLESHPGTSEGPRHLGLLPRTQALDLALSGQGPRPAHPANWRRVFDVERRPSSTRDARGRSLGVGPPPSARRCRGTLMGRCVLHKSSQGSG